MIEVTGIASLANGDRINEKLTIVEAQLHRFKAYVTIGLMGGGQDLGIGQRITTAKNVDVALGNSRYRPFCGLSARTF